MMVLEITGSGPLQDRSWVISAAAGFDVGNRTRQRQEETMQPCLRATLEYLQRIMMV